MTKLLIVNRKLIIEEELLINPNNGKARMYPTKEVIHTKANVSNKNPPKINPKGFKIHLSEKCRF
jgi:hypothetical protein